MWIRQAALLLLWMFDVQMIQEPAKRSKCTNTLLKSAQITTPVFQSTEEYLLRPNYVFLCSHEPAICSSIGRGCNSTSFLPSFY
ncbi:hypothetical protein DFH09DRAFT_73075 [Mycena vulgaris]|nr:hypothetical protein DFH09DRAFT_73075 [Mycena vulgaris]